MKARISILIAASLLMQACQLSRLRKDLKNLETVAHLKVEVDAPRETSGSIVVALLAPEEVGLSIASYGVASSDGTVELPAPSGPHYLVGFQDLNGNFEYDEGEPAGRYGDPSILDLEPGASLEAVRLNLSLKGGELERWPTEFIDQARAAKVDPRMSVMGEVVTLDDPRFAPDIASSGQWAPAAFISAGNRTGVYFLEEYDATKPPVLLVHGIGGSPRAFSEVVEALQEAGFQPWLFYYPSGIRIDLSAALLARSVRELHAVYGVEGVQIVGHSMGGLVATAAVNRLAARGDASLCDRLVTISSPFGGLESAEIGVEFSPAVVPSWRDLAEDSEFIEELPEDRPSDLSHVLFFTFGGPRISVGNSDGVVSLESQLRPEIQDRAADLIGVDASHVGILRDPRALDQLVAALSR